MKIARPKIKKAPEENFQRLLAQESLILDVTEEICRILASAEISRQELAKRLGKSKGFVTQVLSGERNMTLRTAADLANALDHRLHIKAIPSKSPAGGTVPLYFPISSFQKEVGKLQGSHSTPLGAIPTGWNDLARRSAEAHAEHQALSHGRWTPATKSVECDDLPDNRIPDHEFSLSA